MARVAFEKVLQGHACGVMWPGAWLLNLFSQVCFFVPEIITSVAVLPLLRPLCRHVFICLVIIARSWMSWFRDSAWVWVNVCVRQGTEQMRKTCSKMSGFNSEACKILLQAHWLNRSMRLCEKKKASSIEYVSLFLSLCSSDAFGVWKSIMFLSETWSNVIKRTCS